MKKFTLLISLALLIMATELWAQNPAPQNPIQNPIPPPAQVPAPQGAAEDFQIPEDAQQTDQTVQPPKVVNPLPPEMMDPLLEGFFEDVGYNPTDRRDPFLPYLTPSQRLSQGPDVILEPLQKFALIQLKLIGIIWDVGKPKALVQDPAGVSHIIIENTKIGSEMGYVAAIREGEVIVVEQQISSEGKKSFQTKIMKLSSTNVSSGT